MIELTEKQVQNLLPGAWRRIPKTYRDSSPKFKIDGNGLLMALWTELDESFVYFWSVKRRIWVKV